LDRPCLRMKLKIIIVGKIRKGWISEGVEHYRKLLRRYADLEIQEVKEEKIIEGKNESRALEKEGERVLSRLDERDYNIVLDVKGRTLSTEELSQLLETKKTEGVNCFGFIIGGPLGLAVEVKEKADLALSFSRMTTSHELSLLLILEQLYRALDLSAGGKYHK
jgi:23S rRNA (pseudouridine1915-N3)-methyltransferase